VRRARLAKVHATGIRSPAASAPYRTLPRKSTLSDRSPDSVNLTRSEYDCRVNAYIP